MSDKPKLNAYAHPQFRDDPPQSANILGALAIPGTWIGTVVRFRDPNVTHADIVVTGQLAEVHHDTQDTVLWIYTTDAGDKKEYPMPHGLFVEQLKEVDDGL
ncbi:hypothetical protein K8O93_00915 [Gordonia bronchialis]|uniref:hypothetical protein n=1 Tax=Gordonia bronchialis TaxID=2054 RepID=UPI001CBD422E|nr:hypothetical protein [Gordonia bronchialis]UAK38394.1 hypothetical protein K8O93_00915 [Gordonia bronchialis]